MTVKFASKFEDLRK